MDEEHTNQLFESDFFKYDDASLHIFPCHLAAWHSSPSLILCIHMRMYKMLIRNLLYVYMEEKAAFLGRTETGKNCFL